MATNDVLQMFNGVTAYGSSAEGGTQTAYELLEVEIRGQFNMRRSFGGWPELGSRVALTSSKAYDLPSMIDAGIAFAQYGERTLFTYYHEMTGWKDKPKNTIREFPIPLDWRDRNAAWRTHLPSNVSQGAIVMRQDVKPGADLERTKLFLGANPSVQSPWCKWIGFDAYCTDVVNGMSPKQLLTPCRDYARSIGLPWGLAEFSVAGPAAARYEWVQRAIDFVCQGQDVIFWLWFNSGVGDRAPTVYDSPPPSWRLDKAEDGPDAKLTKLWVDLAKMTRDEARKRGNPSAF